MSWVLIHNISINAGLLVNTDITLQIRLRSLNSIICIHQIMEFFKIQGLLFLSLLILVTNSYRLGKLCECVFIFYFTNSPLPVIAGALQFCGEKGGPSHGRMVITLLFPDQCAKNVTFVNIWYLFSPCDLIVLLWGHIA